MLILILILIKISLSIQICEKGKNNCLECNPITYLCFKCDNEYYAPNDNGGCNIRPQCKPGYNNCLECQENSNEKICKNCEKGYFPDQIGGCSYTKNCLLSNNGKCLKCDDGYILVGKEVTYCKLINSQDFKNCQTINITTGFCSNCSDGFYLNSIDKKCSKTENCSESTYGICQKCNKGYYLNKKEEKCMIQENIFINCKESIIGDKCNTCDENHYFDNDGICVNMNYCSLGDKKNTNYCKKCNEGYYLSEFKDSCTNDNNCYEGEKNIGICLKCKSGYYIDFKDGKCKSNIENNEFKHCQIADNNACRRCLYGYNLGEDLKCSVTKNCIEVKDGNCILCSNNYYLGLDNRCSIIENCIYSSDIEDCLECKDNYYLNKRNWKCEISSGIFEGCKYGYDDWQCFACKNNYYLNQTDNLCYSNEIEGNFYKCAMTDFNANYCAKCIDNYNLGEKDHRCTLLKGCKLTNYENKCIECDEDYCLDVNKGICEYNFKIINEETKMYFMCNRTNEDGTKCEICIDGFKLSDEGLCVNMDYCVEKNENGDCEKCMKNENGNYCLNHHFGCIETYFDDCLECDDILDFDKCTKCKEGYEIGEYDLCYEIE